MTRQDGGRDGGGRDRDEDLPRSADLDRAQSLSDADQTHADSDQTAADADEGSSAADEASSYSDQQDSDRDQAASDSDQAVADRDETAGDASPRNAEHYEDSRATRSYATGTRIATTARRGSAQSERSRQELAREQTARRRDETAAMRDRVAEQRDQAAALADRRARASETVTEALELVLGASAAAREQAAADRTRAADDRVRAAVDRDHAAEERRQARIAVQRAQLDSLTGVYMRDLGRVTLQHEIDRCRRSGEPFVLGFIDVDGLKALNDTKGHAAGDALLQAVVAALKSKLRSYDPIVRVGGDEFLCGFVSAEIEAAERRALEIRNAVREGTPPGTVSIGLAVLQDRDTLESLTARADADMYARKSQTPGAE